MKTTPETTMDKHRKIVRGLEMAYEKLVKFKRKNNSPLIVSENGKVIELDPFKAPDKVVYKGL